MISIVVPAYNAENYIKECIESVVNQQFDDYELLITNDASQDTTLSICQEYEKKYKNIKVFSNIKNMGEGMTRNVGIDNAIGDYVLFLDSDDKLFPNALLYMNKMIEKYKFDIMTYPLNTEKNKSSNAKCKLYSGDDAFRMFLCYRRMSGYAGGKLIKRELIGEDRFEKLRIGADGDFMIRMFSKAKNVLYCTEHLYYYRVYDNSASERNIFTEKMLDGINRLPIIRNNLFSANKLNEYEPLFCVFEFRTLFARLEKMINTNSVDEYRDTFDSIINRIKEIEFNVVKYTIRWNVKNLLYLAKFWMICIRYKK